MKKCLFLCIFATLLFACGVCAGCTLSMNGNTHEPPKNEIMFVSGSEGLSYDLSKDGTYAICTGADSATDKDITIASHYQNVVVKEIASNAFADNDFMETLVIPAGIEKIQHKAFYQCEKLTEVNLPFTLTNIAVYAFQNCKSLARVTIADNNSLNKIGTHAFSNCTALISFSVGNNSALKIIDENAFNTCSKMNFFDLGENSKLEEIGWAAFQYTNGLSKFFIPKSVTRIGGYAFGAIGEKGNDGYRTTWLYVESEKSGTMWDSFWNSSNAHVAYNRSYADFLSGNK